MSNINTTEKNKLQVSRITGEIEIYLKQLKTYHYIFKQ